MLLQYKMKHEMRYRFLTRVYVGTHFVHSSTMYRVLYQHVPLWKHRSRLSSYFYITIVYLFINQELMHIISQKS